MLALFALFVTLGLMAALYGCDWLMTRRSSSDGWSEYMRRRLQQPKPKFRLPRR